MNTQINFHCTHFQYGTFEKINLFTVVEGKFTKDEAKDWLDENSESIYNQLDLDTVFEWRVSKVKKTLEDVKLPTISEVIEGRLSFRKKKLKIKKEDALLAPAPKEYHSCWIEPNGKRHNVTFAGHNTFAINWLEKNDPKKLDEIMDSVYKNCYEGLQELGWCRVLGWTTPVNFVLPQNITVKMRQALKSYCQGEEVPYKDWPEILKS